MRDSGKTEEILEMLELVITELRKQGYKITDQVVSMVLFELSKDGLADN